MSSGLLEILVEPFKEDDPGPHVMAVLDVLNRSGFVVQMGPFSTTAEGPMDQLVGALEPMMVAGFAAGASSIQARLEQR